MTATTGDQKLSGRQILGLGFENGPLLLIVCLRERERDCFLGSHRSKDKTTDKETIG